MFGGSAPKAPAPPPPPATMASVSPSINQAKTAAAAAAGSMGFNSTVKTSPLGAAAPTTAAPALKSTLGA